LTKEPLYWGSWKGRVVRAIAIDGARTWSEIRDQTGLSPKSMQRVLAELFQLEALEKRVDGEETIYRVVPNIYKAYREFFESQQKDMKSDTAKITESDQKELINWIGQWMMSERLDFSLQHHHFFLKGGQLDSFSERLILNSKKQVLVVNPYVDQCNLSDSLWKTMDKKKEVVLITQPLEKEKIEASRIRKEKQLKILREKGVRVITNERVHAKIIVVDKAVAIVSSMNFTSLSEGGSSWEAGLVTKEDNVVETIIDSILTIIERPDSEEY
jgi:phosphatidylserine/phosphatidylglycerophosphate/cardiolipin synthase-like enzyme